MKMTLCPFCMKETGEGICPHCGKAVSYVGDTSHLQAGYVLTGAHPYIFGAPLGQGGFGITYIALDMETNQRVAIKEYFPTYCARRGENMTVLSYLGQDAVYNKGKDRFLDEARVLKSLSDLNSIVNVLDFFELNNSAYLVMEFLEGDSLKSHALKNGKFPAQSFMQQMRPLMEDIERMHQRGVVHRDIAPDNIILTPDGQMKLIDFGAARSYVGDKSMTVVVKKGFAPIEQYMRHGSTAATDVYALAATVYYCITGVVPPDSAERQYDADMLKTPISLGAELSREQERAILKALEVQPKKRTQSVAELIKALDHAPKPEKPKPVKKAEKTKEEPKKKAKWVIPAIAAAILCIVGAVLFVDKESPAVPAETAPQQMEVPEATIPETEPLVVLSVEAQKYNEAVDFFNNGEYGKAAIAFAKLGDYRDAKEISLKIWDAIAEQKTFVANNCAFAVKEDGTAVRGKFHGREQPDVSSWTDVIALDGGGYGEHAVGLRSDGTVLLSGTKKTRLIEEDGWTDIVSVTMSGPHVFGIRYDGTVVACKIDKDRKIPNEDIFLEKVAELRDVVKIGLGTLWEGETTNPFQNITSLWIWTADGTVLYNFEPYEDQTVIDVTSVGFSTVMLRKDGTVYCKRSVEERTPKKIADTVSTWTDIVSINGFRDLDWEVMGIKADGTVVGYKSGELNKWTDVVAIDYPLGLRSDGTMYVLSDYSSDYYINKIKAWKNIRLPADREALLVAIELDYITEE